MPSYEMTEVIAARTYTFEQNGRRMSIVIEIGKPARVPDRQEVWYCPWRVQGLRGSEQEHAIGVDSVQALISALSVVRMALEHTATKGRLSFEGQEGVFIQLT